ncbi:MAG: QueT transporter family protein [Oscillospiraceae bacterium]
MKLTTRQLTTAALIAAMYATLTVALSPFSFGTAQVRIAEALTLLPIFSPVAIWGVTLGCALSNIIGVMTGANILGVLDVIFGTAATFIAAVLSYKLRNVRFMGLPMLSTIPPIILNGLIVGGELTVLIAGGWNTKIFIIQSISVAVGEAVSCLIFGLVLVYALEKTGVSKILFGKIVSTQ